LEILGELVVNHVGQIASIIENHVQGFSARKASDGLLDTPVVLIFGLSLPRENWNPGCSNAM